MLCLCSSAPAPPVYQLIVLQAVCSLSPSSCRVCKVPALLLLLFGIPTYSSSGCVFTQWCAALFAMGLKVKIYGPNIVCNNSALF
eukprot:9733113-Heterocapsa_arctica.AAC.1